MLVPLPAIHGYDRAEDMGPTQNAARLTMTQGIAHFTAAVVVLHSTGSSRRKVHREACPP